MKMTVQITGIEPLRRAASGMSRTIDKGLRPAIRNSALEVQARARHSAERFVVDRFYLAGIRYEIKAGGLTAVVGSIAPGAASIEQGRRAGEIVPFGLILRWVERRKLARLASIKTRRLLAKGKRRRPDIERAERALAWEIVQKIKAHGTKALPHLMPAAKETAPHLRERIRDAVRTALRAPRS